MMDAQGYLGWSRLFRRLKIGPHGQLVERYAARLVEDGLVRHGTWQCLNLVGGLLSWIASSRSDLADLDERMVDRYLRHRGGKQSIQPGDRAALKRWLSVLRETGTITPAALQPITPQDQIFQEFGDYLRRERGLAPRSIVSHLPAIRRFLNEVCPAGAGDLGRISQDDVTRYVERHARDGCPEFGKAMCWSLRAFLRYLHHSGLNPLALAGCGPSIRQWKLASLPTYLSTAQVQKVLDGCDRTTVMGRRDYAILMMLAKLGFPALRGIVGGAPARMAGGGPFWPRPAGGADRRHPHQRASRSRGCDRDRCAGHLASTGIDRRRDREYCASRSRKREALELGINGTALDGGCHVRSQQRLSQIESLQTTSNAPCCSHRAI